MDHLNILNIITQLFKISLSKLLTNKCAKVSENSGCITFNHLDENYIISIINMEDCNINLNIIKRSKPDLELFFYITSSKIHIKTETCEKLISRDERHEMDFENLITFKKKNKYYIDDILYIDIVKKYNNSILITNSYFNILKYSKMISYKDITFCCYYYLFLINKVYIFKNQNLKVNFIKSDLLYCLYNNIFYYQYKINILVS